ncbi:putative toxin-antitoxin system toxin component, PIN family protein [Salinisphaera sp. PC39]|uniref:putative toxin-antitoxin system toxin component, PIN family n=1 Tax=Salinisphaera sp. PC39 TaxID=1304156 RepID=UPI003341F684
MRVDRYVVDTNVLISALLIDSSTPGQLVRTLASGGATLLFSSETFAELAIRLSKPKFDPYRTASQRDAYLDWLVELGEWVEPSFDVDACRDADDNKFLALALSAEADCIITGDGDLLDLHPFEGVSILTPADALASL